MENSATIESSQSRFRRVMGPTFSSLKHRNYRLFFNGQLISNTGNWMTNVALTLLVLDITHSGLAVGLLAAFQFGPILLLSAWGGVIADHTDKRLMLLLTQSLEMAQSVGLAIVAFMPHPPVTALFILATVGGVVLAVDNPLRRSFVSEMVSDKDIPNAVVLYSTVVNLSRVFGPALAGVLIITIGYGWCFSIDAISYVAVIISLMMMRARELYRKPPPPRKSGEIRAGLRYVVAHPVLWISFFMLMIIGIFTYNFGVTLPLFVTDGLHQSKTVYTVIYSIMSAGSVIAAFIVARLRLIRLKHTIIGAAALGVSTLFLAISPNVELASVAAFFVGASSLLYTTSTTALVQIEARPDMRGRVLALQSVLLIGTTPLGAPLLGWLADSLGGQVPLIVGFFASVVAAGIAYVASRSHRRELSRHLTS